MTQVRTTSPDLPSLTTPSRSSTPDMVLPMPPLVARPTLPRPEDTLRPRPPTRLVAAHRCTQRRRRAQASRLFADSRPRPPPTATREKKVDSRQVQNMSRTHDCKSLNAANDLRFVAEVWQEIRHTSGVSQGKTKTLHQRHAALPPSKKTKPQKNPRPAGPPPPKIPQSITGRSHRPPPASPRRLRRPVSVNVSCVHVKRERMCIPRRGSSGDQPTGPRAPPPPGFPPRCRSPAPPENGRGTRFSPAGSRPGQG